MCPSRRYFSLASLRIIDLNIGTDSQRLGGSRWDCLARWGIDRYGFDWHGAVGRSVVVDGGQYPPTTTTKHVGLSARV